MIAMPLDSLSASGFRVFTRLEVPRLGRINLITGRNGAGKTCLLEAVRTLVSRGDARTLLDILGQRGEFNYQRLRRDEPPSRLAQTLEALRGLFCGWPELDDSPAFQIGDGSFELEVAVEWLPGDVTSHPTPVEMTAPADQAGTASHPLYPVLLSRSDHGEFGVPLEAAAEWRYRRGPGARCPCVHVTSAGIRSASLAGYWDNVAATPYEDRVIEWLKTLHSGIQRLAFVGEYERNPVAGVDGSPRPLPLRALGDGAYRLLGMALSVINASDGVLLVDEIDTGLHHSVLKSVWRAIASWAIEVNVQVFATTHSWDCVEAFQAAMAEADEPDDGLLLRLEQCDRETRVVSYDARRLTIATKSAIEVR